MKRQRTITAFLKTCIAMAAVFAWVWTVCASEDVRFWFVQLSDTHWGSQDSLLLTRAFVDEINALPLRIDFVAHTGDILSDNIDRESVVREGKTILADLKAPVYYVPGNHDVTPRITNAVELYARHFGKINYRVDHRGVRCLFWGSAYGKGLIEADGIKPFEWLEQELKDAGRQPVLIFQHSPAVDDFYDSKVHEGWEDDAYRRWTKLLRGGEVRAVITGHFHRDELHWIGDVPIYVSTPVIRYFERQPSYRIYEYRNGKLSYTTQYREVKKKRSASSAKSEATGAEVQSPTTRGAK